jgi:ubiquinone biosynthesis protein UbiJ
METIQALEKHREQVLGEMAKLRSMESGSLSPQMLKVSHKGKKDPALRGPYYVLSKWKDGKTHSRRVKKGELSRVQADVANYQRFVELCERFVDLTRRLGALERRASTEQEAQKKGLKSRSNRAPKPGA